jgi:erythromycin esterase-like protein/predicted phosphoribosyltransferase
MTRAPAAPLHVFRDRQDAGRVLAGLLHRYRDRPDVVVLALPRGGVPVAYEVAQALHAPLDVFTVRKLGVPGHEELAMGAIASGGLMVLVDDVVRGLTIAPADIQAAAEREGRELLRRETTYREGRPRTDVTGRTVIVVDDGLATGASMQAAVQALRSLGPAEIVVAVPAAPESTARDLAALADTVVCAATPTPFLAVGAAYWDFQQTSDTQVRDLLRAAGTGSPPGTTAAPETEPPDDLTLLRAAAIPVAEGTPGDDVLFDLVGGARIVLIGEASHGTHEFYAARARMTRRLIEQKRFRAVAVEGDWPDAYRVNQYVRGRSKDETAEEALRGFRRFPSWMWRNEVVLDFIAWLRERNDQQDAVDQAGFYGLDLYSLNRSAGAVLSYLDGVDPAAAERARERYACLDHHTSDDGEVFGRSGAFGAGEACEREVIEQLVDLSRKEEEYSVRDGLLAEDEFFCAEQNARVVKAAASYYRAMFGERASTWNQRDLHMTDTLDALLEHLSREPDRPAKIVVWAHNSHLGDARATETSARGELNVGQLVRERHGGECRTIGFTTSTGTVTAADHWGGTAHRKQVRPGLTGSVEELFHQTGLEQFLLRFDEPSPVADLMTQARLERAIGVIYRPRTERASHYFHARTAEQFDAVIHLDRTRALTPLEPTSEWAAGEEPETYPSGL